MEKPIKNRSVFAKLIYFSIILCIMLCTILCVGCTNKSFDKNSYSIEFNKKQATFILPEDAKLSVQNQIKYYVYEEVSPVKTKVSNEYVKYSFDNSVDTSKYTFKIEKDGIITKSGYFQKEGKFKLAINDNAVEDSLIANVVDTSSLMLTNVSNNYFKVLSKDESFELTAFRNSSIVNSLYGNVQIEPTFECNVLEGESISINRVKENVFTIKALKEGVTFVKLNYSQIDVFSNSKLYSYPSCDEDMQVVITFAVGDNYTNDIKVTGNGREFDSEFDIVYFEGDNGNFELEALDIEKVICNNVEVPSDNGKYDLTINQGYNIIELKSNDKTMFMTLYGRKINIDIKGDCVVGGEITINVSGILTILPKLSGVYNPTQKYLNGETPSQGSNLCCIIAESELVVADNVSQYDFSKNTIIKFVIKNEHIVNGKLNIELFFNAEWWGMAMGSHRYISSSGLQSNINAEKYNKNIGFFEKISIDIK